VPRVDAHPQDLGLPPELDPLAAQRLSIRTTVELCIDCQGRQRRPDREPQPETGEKEKPDEHHHPDKPPRGDLRPVCFKVEVHAIAHAERTSSPDGDAVRVIVDALELVDLRPDELESVIECLLLQILRAALASVRLPLTALRAGAFQLLPTAGPLVEDDRVEMFGDV
jgi:hypothetical protein